VRTLLPGALLGLVAVAGYGCGSTDTEPSGRTPEPFRSDALEQGLDRVRARLETRGLAEEGEPFRGFLVQAETVVHEAPLDSGECAVLAARASSGVHGVELQLFDVEGTSVARVAAPAPHAALRYCAPQRGLYYVGVRSTEGHGLYELRRFRGPRGLELRLEGLFDEPPAQVASP
jgi:hypothetical protein